MQKLSGKKTAELDLGWVQEPGLWVKTPDLNRPLAAGRQNSLDAWPPLEDGCMVCTKEARPGTQSCCLWFHSVAVRNLLLEISKKDSLFHCGRGLIIKNESDYLDQE